MMPWACGVKPGKLTGLAGVCGQSLMIRWSVKRTSKNAIQPGSDSTDR
jgi:hypothetical protein